VENGAFWGRQGLLKVTENSSIQ